MKNSSQKTVALFGELIAFAASLLLIIPPYKSELSIEYSFLPKGLICVLFFFIAKILQKQRKNESWIFIVLHTLVYLALAFIIYLRCDRD
jgi:hypothetical protein